jgi:hypothetical protein
MEQLEKVRKAARLYLKHGWYVIPIKYKEKGPKTKAWQNLRITEAEVDNYFHGDMTNIGILAGACSDLFILDLDVNPWKSKGNYIRPNPDAKPELWAFEQKYGSTIYAPTDLDSCRGSAFHWWEKLTKQYGTPNTTVVKTGSGGQQWYFRYPHNSGLNNQSGRVHPAVDWKTDGGQVVAPPSIHPNGTRYTLANVVDPVECPEWLLDALRKGDWTTEFKKSTKVTVDIDIADLLDKFPEDKQPVSCRWKDIELDRSKVQEYMGLTVIPNGRRKKTLASIAGYLCPPLWGEELVNAVLPHWRKCEDDPDDPITEKRVRDICRWVEDRERAKQATGHGGSADTKDGSTYAKLYAEMMPYREFPLDIFPKDVQTAIHHFRKQVNCPIDYVANPILVGVAWANSTKVIIQARGIIADLKLWLMSIARSSIGKSLPAKLLINHLSYIDQKLREKYDGEMSDHYREKLVYESKMARLRRKGEVECNKIDDPPTKPVCREVLLTNATLEGMTRVIKNSPNGTVLNIDDFLPWWGQLGKYNSAAPAAELSALQQYFDSEYNEPVKHSRAKQEDSTHIDRHYLCLLGNIQPNIADRTLFHPDLRESGFIHRLLYYWPDTTVYEQPTKKQYEMPEKYAQAIPDMLKGLSKQTYDADWGDAKMISIDAQSDAVTDKYFDFWLTLDRYEHDETLDPVLCSNVGRMKKHLSKIIGNLHLLQCYAGGSSIDVIDVSTIDNAITLARYYLSSFLKIYNLYFKRGSRKTVTEMDETANTDKDKVLAYVKEHPSVTATQIRDAKKRSMTIETVRTTLVQLEEDGMGTCVKDDNGMVTGFNYKIGA